MRGDSFMSLYQWFISLLVNNLYFYNSKIYTNTKTKWYLFLLGSSWCSVWMMVWKVFMSKFEWMKNCPLLYLFSIKFLLSQLQFIFQFTCFLFECVSKSNVFKLNELQIICFYVSPPCQLSSVHNMRGDILW